jgi:hypothetical protein
MPGPPIIIDGGTRQVTITTPNAVLKVAPTDRFENIEIWRGEELIQTVILEETIGWEIKIE